jgi:glycerophosphoryl diester phosphodiesterase
MILNKQLAAAAGLLLAACATTAPSAQTPAAKAPAAQTPAIAPPVAAPLRLLPADSAAFFDCLRRNKLAVIGAHRMGYSDGLPENARITGEFTLALTPALLETDVRQTKDGVLVIMHDDDLARTSTGAGKISESDYGAIKNVKLKTEAGQVMGEPIPTLAEMLDWAKTRTILQLDVKRGVSLPAVVEAVRNAGADHRVIIIVYTTADAIAVAKLNPKLMLSVSINEMADLDALRAGGVDLSRVLAFTGTRTPNPALYEALSKTGVEVIFGTLGKRGESLDDRYAQEGEAGYAKLMAEGVQVIATNRAAVAAKAIDTADGPGFAPAQCLTAKGPAQ